MLPSAALIGYLDWFCREFELLGECGRVPSCDSGVITSDTTQLVHAAARNPACIYAGCNSSLWEWSGSRRTIMYFTVQNASTWKAGYTEALCRKSST